MLIWVPVAVLLGYSLWAQAFHPERAFLSSGLTWLAAVLLVAYALLALWFPRRSMHDWLAGTHLVPK